MNPMLLQGLMSFAPALLSKIGLFGDPQADYRKRVGKILASQPGLTQKYYNQALGSPAYSQAQGTIAAGANATGGQLQSALGARGIGESGTGAILSSLLPSIVGQQQAGLRTSAYNSGQQQAQQEIQARIAALTGGAPGGVFGPSQSQQLFAGGLEAFLPALLAMLQKNPGLLGGGGAGQPMRPGPMPMTP